MTYEAWIDTGKGSVRIIEIKTSLGIRQAYRLAEMHCGEGEYVRGVNEVEA